MKDSKIVNKRNTTPVHPIGATFFITCSLKGAIEENELLKIKEEYNNRISTIGHADTEELSNDRKYIASRKYLLDIDEKLNANTGPTFLASPEIARVLLARIESYHMRYYKLLALSILPNHFHMLIDTSVQIKEIYDPNTVPKNYVQLDKIISLIKEGSARYINHYCKIDERQVWEDENFDTYIRDEKMLSSIINHIKTNPVKAGLVRSYEEHPFTFVNDL
ncbi:hypothetical protein [Portibacter lacus]|uniref:Transposase IS200-like domain-containing protein n=1 Tax=Portibacter lacus TaxID=1099794 RepID=A0AA37WGY7_9BACT|nr:hypothetical protein [Portibacter lacus]GLR18719.1 hypothetical protein GCM10007940_33350 [Portibacter lacus]